MANAKIGSQASWGGNYVETITTTKQLTRGDSGKVFMMDSTTAFDVNLPQLSSEIAGWNCKMIVQVSGSVDISVLGYGLPTAGGDDTVANADNDLVVYREFAVADEAGGSAANADGFTIEAAAAVGDTFDIFTDGTKWFVTAKLAAVAGGSGIDS
tara:strand:+ start:648 stop:1112 length:465 start_codon:yes stop_codon:yes gene_type:complete